MCGVSCATMLVFHRWDQTILDQLCHDYVSQELVHRNPYIVCVNMSLSDVLRASGVIT